MKKIGLLIQAGTSEDSKNLIAEPVRFEFIYGLGTSGLSPFEMELDGKREGEEVLIPMTGEQMPSFFQHLLPLPLNLTDREAVFTLKARIEGVSEPDPREVIKAMAQAAECGSHCCGH